MKKYDVLDILKPYDNDRISSMSKHDLYFLKSCLKNYILDLRESLNLSKNVTFGVEIEVDNILDKIHYLRRSKIFAEWLWKSEDTLFNGQEIVSYILKDEIRTWDTLEYVFIKLGDCSEITPLCGGHIHFGSQIFGNNKDAYYNLYLLWQAYENIIFRFGYGEFISERDNIDKYAIPFLLTVQNTNPTDYFFELHSRMCLSYGKISENNLEEYKRCIVGNTIEVRSPNGSLNPIIWQNNINFFAKLMLYATSKNFNKDLILNRIEEIKDKSNMYGGIFTYLKMLDLEKAVELADLIFDNNLDKVYFLRQYIKNEEVGIKVLEKGTKFTNFKYY